VFRASAAMRGTARLLGPRAHFTQVVFASSRYPLQTLEMGAQCGQIPPKITPLP
jgi:hypothetical protein